MVPPLTVTPRLPLPSPRNIFFRRPSLLPPRKSPGADPSGLAPAESMAAVAVVTALPVALSGQPDMKDDANDAGESPGVQALPWRGAGADPWVSNRSMESVNSVGCLWPPLLEVAPRRRPAMRVKEPDPERTIGAKRDALPFVLGTDAAQSPSTDTGVCASPAFPSLSLDPKLWEGEAWTLRRLPEFGVTRRMAITPCSDIRSCSSINKAVRGMTIIITKLYTSDHAYEGGRACKTMNDDVWGPGRTPN